MANIIVPPQQNPTKLSSFLGLNEETDGDLGLKLGEASSMFNFTITNNFKLKQRDGYLEKFCFGSGLINGMIVYKGKLIVAHGGSLYSFESTEL